MIEEILTQIGITELKKGKWYVGRGRYSNISYWNGQKFLTVNVTSRAQRIEPEPYYLERQKTGFQPFKAIEEGEITLPSKEQRHGKPYGAILKIESVKEET